MSTHQIQVRPTGLPVLNGARYAAGTQLAIIGIYLVGAVVPALWAGLFPLHAAAGDAIALWPESAGVPLQLLHVLAFFAASVGLVVTLACVPMCLAVLARHWRRQGRAARALFSAAAVLGIVFLAFSATPWGYALRDFLAS